MHLVPSSDIFQREAERNGADYSLTGLLEEMDEHQVERALLIGHWDIDDGSSDGPFRNRANNEILETLEQGGDRFRGLLTVNMRGQGAMDLDVLDEHLRKNRRLVGVKFFLGYEAFYPNDLRCEPVYDMLERRGKLAVFHTGDTLVPNVQLKYAHPMPLDDVAVAHPDLPIVVAHAGQHWMHDGGELVGKNPNVWADVSGWFLGNEIPWFMDYVKTQFMEMIYWADTADRLMFGSDWPLTRMHVYHEFMRRCDFLPEEQRRKIMYENARRLYWGEE